MQNSLCVIPLQGFAVASIAMSKVSVPSENAAGACPAVLAGDVSKTKRGVVVLQEWWGLNQQIQDEAKQLSDEGSFVTIVPDLYRGKVRVLFAFVCFSP